MAVTNLSQITTPLTGLTLERLQGYLIEAGKEFSFTGFSTYFALAKRTLQLSDRDGHFDGLAADDREQMLSEPDGLLIRGILGMIPQTPDFPSAWRFVRRDWAFSDRFRSIVASELGSTLSGGRLQRLLAISAGVPIGLDDELVPLPYRRER
jgi:hypothetical protein